MGEDEKLQSADDLRSVNLNKKLGRFFGFNDSEQSSDVKSCLLVSVDKKELVVPDDGKVANRWIGNFSWFWSVVNGNRAFVTLNTAETSRDKQLRLSGILYLLEKEKGINDSN